MLNTSHRGGFTIVELLIGMSLLAVLLGIGAPMMGRYLQNSKIASAAGSYFNGVQTARTEAIRRNVRTEFVLTDTPVSTANLANALAAATGGRNWVVRAASGPGAYLPVEAKAGAEGDAAPGAAALVVSSSASAIPFNGFGATADGGAYSINISNPAAGACVADGGTIRCRRINVSPGGQITSCDPAASAPGDSRGC